MKWTQAHEICFWVVMPLFALAPFLVPIVIILTVTGVLK